MRYTLDGHGEWAPTFLAVSRRRRLQSGAATCPYVITPQTEIWRRPYGSPLLESVRGVLKPSPVERDPATPPARRRFCRWLVPLAPAAADPHEHPTIDITAIACGRPPVRQLRRDPRRAERDAGPRRRDLAGSPPPSLERRGRPAGEIAVASTAKLLGRAAGPDGSTRENGSSGGRAGSCHPRSGSSSSRNAQTSAPPTIPRPARSASGRHDPSFLPWFRFGAIRSGWRLPASGSPLAADDGQRLRDRRCPWRSPSGVSQK